jgi:pantoate--beta-alanine ligase
MAARKTETSETKSKTKPTKSSPETSKSSKSGKPSGMKEKPAKGIKSAAPKEAGTRKMAVVHTINDYIEWVNEISDDNPDASIGLVPTMGALHAGHMALVDRARRECDIVVATIFVNPLQFGPNEDFDRYPRALENDLAMCREHDVDCVFNPTVGELYTGDLDSRTTVEPPERLIDRLCGVFRPGHFRGVATIVMKLFNITLPDVAFFGEKDYQQLVVIRQMVEDLNHPVQVVGVPTVRESDGLAMSSRNQYLTSVERARAPELNAVLREVNQMIVNEQSTVRESLDYGTRKLIELGFDVQYLEACNPVTLEKLESFSLPMVLLVAAKLGQVRLIDNLIVRAF